MILASASLAFSTSRFAIRVELLNHGFAAGCGAVACPAAVDLQSLGAMPPKSRTLH